jgi:hypothetical protein
MMVCPEQFSFPPFPTVIGGVKEGMAVIYITVIKNGQFYCSFGTCLASTTISVCKSYKNSIF